HSRAYILDPPPFPTRRSSDLLFGGCDRPRIAHLLELARIDVVDEAADGDCIRPARRQPRMVQNRRDAAPHVPAQTLPCEIVVGIDRKSTRLNSSHVKISYAVF